MAKSILWRTDSRKLEFSRTTDNRLSVAISEGNTEPILNICLSVEDIRGIREIMDDIRCDIEWEMKEASEKEVGNV